MVEETVPFCYDRPTVGESKIGEDLSSVDRVLFPALREYHVVE